MTSRTPCIGGVSRSTHRIGVERDERVEIGMCRALRQQRLGIGKRGEAPFAHRGDGFAGRKRDHRLCGCHARVLRCSVNQPTGPPVQR